MTEKEWLSTHCAKMPPGTKNPLTWYVSATYLYDRYTSFCRSHQQTPRRRVEFIDLVESVTGAQFNRAPLPRFHSIRFIPPSGFLTFGD